MTSLDLVYLLCNITAMHDWANSDWLSVNLMNMQMSCYYVVIHKQLGECFTQNGHMNNLDEKLQKIVYTCF